MMDPARGMPVLASLDISETRDFYVRYLGFSSDYVDDNYLIVKRGEMEIHFWKTDDQRFSRNSGSAACRACRPSR